MLSPGQTLGRYRIVRLLREGQAAESYVALEDEKQVLLKLFRADVIEAAALPDLQAFAERLRAAKCPHLVPLSEVAFGQDLDQNRALIVRPWVEGKSLGEQMARLARLAHTVVWVNPHAGKRGYEPVQGGIAAALPHVDRLLAGHSLATLQELTEVLADA